MAVSITKHNFKPEVEEAAKPVVIEFFATWCGPCQHMATIFQELEKEFSDKYVFAKVNVDESREIATDYKVSSVPTFLFIKNNELQGKEVGVMSKEDFKAKLQELFD